MQRLSILILVVLAISELKAGGYGGEFSQPQVIESFSSGYHGGSGSYSGYQSGSGSSSFQGDGTLKSILGGNIQHNHIGNHNIVVKNQNTVRPTIHKQQTFSKQIQHINKAKVNDPIQISQNIQQPVNIHHKFVQPYAIHEKITQPIHVNQVVTTIPKIVSKQIHHKAVSYDRTLHISAPQIVGRSAITTPLQDVAQVQHFIGGKSVDGSNKGAIEGAIHSMAVNELNSKHGSNYFASNGNAGLGLQNASSTTTFSLKDGGQNAYSGQGLKEAHKIGLSFAGEGANGAAYHLKSGHAHKAGFAHKNMGGAGSSTTIVKIGSGSNQYGYGCVVCGGKKKMFYKKKHY